MSSDHTRRVLVADDDQAVCELLSKMLRDKGLLVDCAADGAEALELLGTNDYAVLVLDLLMPKVSGFDVLQQMHDGDQPPPVVLVVTGADRPAIERLDSRRIHGIVRKPFDPVELATLIAACADIRGRNALGTMAIATMIAGGPFLALLSSKM
jgi:CheY-like chemotaxis protein